MRIFLQMKEWNSCVISILLVLCIILGMSKAGCSQQSGVTRPVPKTKQDELEYSKDDRGNRNPDYSYAGYMAGEQPIPDVPVRIVVPLKQGDDTRRIQAAIDYVASLKANEQGIRGAVLL